MGHLMEDAHDHHINLADIVHIVDALVQAADHVHSGGHWRPGRHGSVSGVRAVRGNHRVACIGALAWGVVPQPCGACMLTEGSTGTCAWPLERVCLVPRSDRQYSFPVRDTGCIDGQAVLQHYSTALQYTKGSL